MRVDFRDHFLGPPRYLLRKNRDFLLFCVLELLLGNWRSIKIVDSSPSKEQHLIELKKPIALTIEPIRIHLCHGQNMVYFAIKGDGHQSIKIIKRYVYSLSGIPNDDGMTISHIPPLPRTHEPESAWDTPQKLEGLTTIDSQQMTNQTSGVLRSPGLYMLSHPQM